MEEPWKSAARLYGTPEWPVTGQRMTSAGTVGVMAGVVGGGSLLSISAVYVQGILSQRDDILCCTTLRNSLNPTSTTNETARNQAQWPAGKPAAQLSMAELMAACLNRSSCIDSENALLRRLDLSERAGPELAA
jgi:hypothetical protein